MEPEPTDLTRLEVSSVEIVAIPWVFTQHHPLDANDFIRQAKDRGVDLDLLKLRQLYKVGVLVPLVALTTQPKSAPQEVTVPEPRPGGTRQIELRAARATGRLMDLKSAPFMPRLRFSPPKDRQVGWWNGLLYSHHQLAILPKLDHILSRCKYTYRNGQLYPHLPDPDPFLKHRAAWYHRIALMATALEARYLPVLDPEWLHLVNTERDEYNTYRRAFDPVAMSEKLKYPADLVRKDAEELLLIAHAIEPTGGWWSQLLRRAPRDRWKDLKGASRSAMDLRETAEILLRFYEDLAEHGQAEPLEEIPGYAWHPLHERLSSRRETLDQDLMHLGLSPHPRVILAVEGESEELHVPRIWEKLGYPKAPELVRLLKLGGTNKDPVKVAALAVTPLVTGKAADGKYWNITKPPTRFMVVADPENDYAPTRIDGTRKRIIEEIRSGLAAQGAATTEGELNQLVELRTWRASCYEFEHFTDDELAEAIAKVHATCNGWSRNKLVEVLTYWRNQGEDIKRVWKSGCWDAALNRPVDKWSSEVSKTRLAEVLWPVLEQKIKAAMSNEQAPVPAVVQVVADAFAVAQNWRYKSFVLSAMADESTAITES